MSAPPVPTAHVSIIEHMTDEALAFGVVVTRWGYVVVPDVIVIEAMAQGQLAPPSTIRLRRPDGRSALVFLMPSEVTT